MVKLFRLFYLMLSILAFALVMTVPAGCKKEKMLGAGDQPAFSTDTIIFDTVFTTVGSVTEVFKIYNPHKGILHIDNIYIEGGEASYYRLNVDGAPGKAFTDIEIPAEDSIFVFVEVTIDPNNVNTPLVVSDRIVIDTKGNKQHVNLVAWGQDAYFFRPPAGASAYIMPCGATLLTDKPNVFYGLAIVDEGCILNIPAGAKLHFHPGSGLVVYKGALNISGTATNKVVIQGDRLEFDYRDVPGQWEGIRMIQPRNSIISHAEIKNGFYGLWVDTTFSSSHKVTVQKTAISNMASLGIYGNSGARMDVSNTLISNCGLYNVALTYGGTFNFNHCTMANYWSEGSTRSTPAFYFINWFDNNGTQYIRDIDVNFDNCIIYGNLENEFETDLKTAGTMIYNFRKCYIRTTQDITDGHYVGSVKNVDPLFEDTGNDKFKLVAGSPCINTANTGVSSIFVTDDIDDKPRPVPDIGCYEF